MNLIYSTPSRGKKGLVAMSKKRRNFSAKFKSDLVIEAIKGEKTINEIAAENNI